jgi:hypothetical protein
MEQSMRINPRNGALAVFLAVLALGACNTNKLLDVKSPNAVPVDLFNDPKNATLMVNSAIADFECAAGAAILIEGIISDDLADAQLGAAQWPYDRRDANTQTNGVYGTSGCTSSQGPGIYTPLSTARWDADTAIAKLTKWTDTDVPNRTTLLAQMNLYSGFSYALLGMSMCKAAFDLGPAVDQKGVFALAEQRFTAAITGATALGLTNIVNAALVGRARVRLFQGNNAGAIADATLVPKGFVYNIAADATDARRYNKIFNSLAQTGNYTVESLSLNLKTENGEADPRAAVNVTATRPADSKSVISVPKKFAGGLATPTPLARYEEAQLILAEAQGGAQAVTIINAMRADVALQPYTGATDPASIKNLIIDERRRVLFAEGFRNYDIERFSLTLNPAEGTTYPRVGGVYGNTTCLPLPDVERLNNPSASGG